MGFCSGWERIGPKSGAPWGVQTLTTSYLTQRGHNLTQWVVWDNVRTTPGHVFVVGDYNVGEPMVCKRVMKATRSQANLRTSPNILPHECDRKSNSSCRYSQVVWNLGGSI